MERSGYTPAIQGGGNGSGLKFPSLILLHERRERKSICKALVARSRLIVDVTTSPTDKRKVKVWHDFLTQRLFELHQMNPGPQESVTLPVSQPGDENVGIRNFYRAPVSTLSAFIPKTPRTIEDLVQIWTVGCETSNGHPVRKYESKDFRASVVAGYSDIKWRSSGQRPAYQRLKRLMKLLGQYGDPSIDNVFDQTITEREWNIAINNFNVEWGNVPLTAVLNRTRN